MNTVKYVFCPLSQGSKKVLPLLANISRVPRWADHHKLRCPRWADHHKQWSGLQPFPFGLIFLFSVKLQLCWNPFPESQFISLTYQYWVNTYK